MTHSLGERQGVYEECYDFSITRKIPIVIKAQLRNYKRLIQNLAKPFSPEFSEILGETALFVISQIDDAIFGYCHNDEIILILDNSKKEDTCWLNNKIQSIVSVTASMLTDGFRRSYDIFGENIKLSGNIIFDVKTWGLPNLEEATNYLIHRQDSCIKNSINRACGFELEEKFGREKASALFRNKSYDEKEDILLNHCGIDLYEYYPSNFIFGTAIYKIRSIKIDESAPRNRWYVNNDIPNFLLNKEFLSTILANGADIFRASDFNNLIG